MFTTSPPGSPLFYSPSDGACTTARATALVLVLAFARASGKARAGVAFYSWMGDGGVKGAAFFFASAAAAVAFFVPPPSPSSLVTSYSAS